MENKSVKGIGHILSIIGLALKCCIVICTIYSILATLFIADTSAPISSMIKLFTVIFDNIFWMVIPLCVILYLIILYAGRISGYLNPSIKCYTELSIFTFKLFIITIPIIYITLKFII